LVVTALYIETACGLLVDQMQSARMSFPSQKRVSGFLVLENGGVSCQDIFAKNVFLNVQRKFVIDFI
jgi:hypothetical protein